MPCATCLGGCYEGSICQNRQEDAFSQAIYKCVTGGNGVLGVVGEDGGLSGVGVAQPPPPRPNTGATGWLVFSITIVIGYVFLSITICFAVYSGTKCILGKMTMRLYRNSNNKVTHIVDIRCLKGEFLFAPFWF